MTSRQIKFVIGIPTVRRSYDYLPVTLDSIISQIPVVDRAQVEIVLFNADLPPEHHAQVAALSQTYRPLIDIGFLTILTNPCGHPQLIERFSHADACGDNVSYGQWAAKLVLDCVYLLNFCATRGTYYLHLEDDVIAAEGFWSTFTGWFETHFVQRHDWLTLSLYSPYRMTDRQRYPMSRFYGAIGLLFRCGDLPRLATYMAGVFDQAPLDWLIRDFIIETGGAAYVHAPPLFQHVGLISSLTQKVQLAEAPAFQEGAARRGWRFVQGLHTLLRYRPTGAWPFIRHRLCRWIRRRLMTKSS